jgi:hypothetical protein
MGAKQGRKHQGKPGKVNSALSAQLIGEVNHKRKRTDQDPYGSSERSGKHAKPDACLVAANTQARAAVQPAPVPTSLPASLPAPLPSSHAALRAALTDMPCYMSAQPFSLLQPSSGIIYLHSPALFAFALPCTDVLPPSSYLTHDLDVFPYSSTNLDICTCNWCGKNLLHCQKYSM